MTDLLIFVSIPALLMLIGSIVALYRRPGAELSSIVQHFAGGVVIAAVAIELLPKIINQSKWLLAAGFLVGVALMMVIEWYGHQQRKQPKLGRFPRSMVLAVAIDVFVDGLLIGVAFLADFRSGVVIALALALELLFLGLSTCAAMAKSQVPFTKALLVSIGLALLVPIAAVLGFHFVGKAGADIHYLIMAFGVAALLYLVTEELLIEAHELSDTSLATLAFFIGFLVVLLIS